MGKQIIDSEILNVHIDKIKGISKVAKTGIYDDLGNIPEYFNPTEHTDFHVKSSETTDGIESNTDKSKMDELKIYSSTKFKYSVDPRDIGKGYENLDITLDSEKVILSSGNQSEIEVDTVGKLLRIIGSSLDPEIYIEKKGDSGEKGDDGEDSTIWIPSVSSTGLLTWRASTAEEDYDLIIKIKNQYTDGNKGKDGKDGKNVNLEDVIDLPFSKYSKLGGLLKFLNTSDRINYHSEFSLRILINSPIIFKPVQAIKLSNKYPDGNLSYLYCISNEKFYLYDSINKLYIQQIASNVLDKFSANEFIYDTFYDNLFYLSGNCKLIIL